MGKLLFIHNIHNFLPQNTLHIIRNILSILILEIGILINSFNRVSSKNIIGNEFKFFSRFVIFMKGRIMDTEREIEIFNPSVALFPKRL